MSESPQPTRSRSSKSRSPLPQKPRRSRPRALLDFLGQLGGIVLAFIPVVFNGLLHLGQTVWRGWKALLPRLRSVLPAQLRHLSDWLLTAIVIALLIGLIGLPLTLSRAAVPEPASQPQPVVTVPRSTAARSAQAPRQLAAIRKQLIRATLVYPGDWSEVIQLSAVNHRLQVQVNSLWNQLSASQQKELASEWLRLAQKRAFTGLEVIDPDGTLLARSPVVGSEIVLLSQKSA